MPDEVQIPTTIIESASIDSEIKRLERDKLQEELKSIRQNRLSRRVYAFSIFILICVWFSIIILIVFGVGKEWLTLSDSVLIALITTTTANVAAFLLIVVKYLFPTKGTE